MLVAMTPDTAMLLSAEVKLYSAYPSVARGEDESGLRRIVSDVAYEDTASTIAVQMILRSA